MANENDIPPKEDEVEEVDEIVESKDDDGNDTTDWKAIALKNQGIAKRFKTKLDKSKEVKPPVPPIEKKDTPPEKKEVLDKLDRAVLRLEKITDSDEVKLVEDIMKETGKDIEAVLASKYFKTELQELRDLKDSKNAVPPGSKRTAPGSRDTVEYWIAKGELPPADQVELRRKVVNARMATEKNKSQFTDRPVV